MSESNLIDVIRSRDYSLLIKNASKNIEDAALEYLFIGIDESSNHPEILKLVSILLEKGFAKQAYSLWVQKRRCSDGSILYVYGGVNSKNKSHLQITLGDLGQQIKYESYEDLQVVDYLLSHLLSFGKLLLITENTKNDPEGLRRLLNEKIKPLLNEHHDNKFSMVCFFKKGKTHYSNYCAKVFDYVEQGKFEFGYTEFFI